MPETRERRQKSSAERFFTRQHIRQQPLPISASMRYQHFCPRQWLCRTSRITEFTLKRQQTPEGRIGIISPSLNGAILQEHGTTMTVKNHPVPDLTSETLYTELRLQENIKQALQLVNGDVTSNSVETVSGSSARVCHKGQWGFASLPEISTESINRVLEEARNNATFLAQHQGKAGATLPESAFAIKKDFASLKPARSLEQKLGFLKTVDQYIQTHCPELESRIIRLHLETISKRIHTSTGSEGFTRIPRNRVVYLPDCE